jgi:hypothetical protein
MRTTTLIASFMLSLVLLARPALAEKAPMSPERLRSTATHVVTAEVVAIYSRTGNEGFYRRTWHVAEIRVREVEKGDGIDTSKPLYVRYWTQTWNGPGPPPPGTSGHRGLPKEKDTLRIYLARNAYDGFSTNNTDGGFNVIGANGFEKLTAPAPTSPPPPPTATPPSAPE